MLSWGWTQYGQSGAGAGAGSAFLAPQVLLSLGNVTHVAAGDLRSTARLGDGTLMIRGSNDVRQPGLGSVHSQTSPGTCAWHGLNTTTTEVLAWLDAGPSGFLLVVGPLGAA